MSEPKPLPTSLMSPPRLKALRLCEEASSLEAHFIPAAGMLCSSLSYRGAELLAQNAGADAYARSGKTMGIPLLYPWANRLAGFDYAVAGREVLVPHDDSRIRTDGNGLPIHGVIGGRMRWEILRAPAAGDASLLAGLSWSEARAELFEVFPFRHDLSYEARLSDGRLEIELRVHACGADPVPVCFGFHPYLSLPDAVRDRWLVELPAMRPLRLDAQQIPIGPGRARAAGSFELDSRDFDDGFDAVAEPARFSVASSALRLELALVEGFPCGQVFSPGRAQFICFEPMTAPANALRSGSGLRVLAPGERYVARFSLAPSVPR